MDNSLLVPAIAAVVGGLIVLVGNRAVNRANANAVDVGTIRQLVKDVQDLSEKVIKFEAKMTVLWQYVYSLVEYIGKNGGVPPSPPIDLETDPKLMRLIKEIGVRAADEK